MEPFGLRPGIEIAEGVREICSPMRAKEKNGSPQDGANAGFPKGGMAHTATAPISGARGKHRQARTALAVERPQAKAGPGCGSSPRPGKPHSTAQSADRAMKASGVVRLPACCPAAPLRA